MSAQPIADPQPHDVASRRSQRTRAAGGPRGELVVLPIPETEPPPLPRGALIEPVDRRFVQECLAVDFRLEGHDQLFGPQSTSRADLPEPQQWAARLITAILESMDGLRPATQLGRWVTPEIRERIARRGVLARQRHQRPGGALQIRALRVCEPLDGVAEVAAVIGYRARVRAVALRMSGVDGRWLITALELG